MPGAGDFPDRRVTIPVTIANGQSLSAAVDLVGSVLVGIQMSALWTAAGLSFQASVDNSTFQDLFDSAGTEKTLTVVLAHALALKADDLATFVAWRYLKIRSGTTGAPVAQGADRILTLICRPLY